MKFAFFVLITAGIFSAFGLLGEQFKNTGGLFAVSILGVFSAPVLATIPPKKVKKIP